MLLSGNTFSKIRRAVANEILKFSTLVCAPLVGISLAARDIIKHDTRGTTTMSVIMLCLVLLFYVRNRLSTNVLCALTSSIWVGATLALFYTRGLSSGGPYIFAPTLVFCIILLPTNIALRALVILLGALALLFVLAFLHIYSPMHQPIDFSLATNVQMSPWLVPIVLIPMTSLIVHRVMRMIVMALNNQSQRARQSLYQSMTSVASLRDHDTGSHLTRCALYGEIIATKDPNGPYGPGGSGNLEALISAIPLHDIGKVGVKDAVLLHPGKLQPSDFNEMQQHTIMGQSLIRRFRIENGLEDDEALDLAENIAIAHHENWDGSGYPFGLKGQEIPYEARLMSIIDVYDALRSPRVYKSERTHEATLGIMEKMCGTKFDPDLYNIFTKTAHLFEKIYEENNHHLRPKKADEVIVRAPSRLTLRSITTLQ